jgi:hypothetical protein
MIALQITLFDKSGHLCKHFIIPNPSSEEIITAMKVIMGEEYTKYYPLETQFVDLSDGGLAIYRPLDHYDI